MFLVHVITGPNLFVPVAQIQREIGITLQIHSRRHPVERSEREHFSANFEHENIFAERRAFSRTTLFEAIFTESLKIHIREQINDTCDESESERHSVSEPSILKRA